MRKNQRRNAFTLIEVLIVVIIMAVLAATIIPQFSQSTDDAMDSSVSFNLHTMQTQIEMYRFQHNGNWPEFANIVAQLTAATNVSGGATGDTRFGPYMQEVPANPFNQSNVVVAGDGSALVGGGVAGWQYDATTGRVSANNSEAFE
jgi:general secretion pathway protein G